jgi:3-oxoacid CoA-transferase B subunit
VKKTLDKHDMARRMARELKDGDVVNLGIGIPSLASSYLPKDIQIIFHVENGIIGFGRVLGKQEVESMDYYLANAGGQFIAPIPGMCIVDFAESFDAIRTGRVNITMLGAYQVSRSGDIASWTVSQTVDEVSPSSLTLGGAMDMPIGPKKVIIGMKHVTNDGKPRIVNKCGLPLTAVGKAKLIITDVAVIQVTPAGLELLEVAPDWDPEEVQAITEPPLIISQKIKQMF